MVKNPILKSEDSLFGEELKFPSKSQTMFNMNITLSKNSIPKTPQLKNWLLITGPSGMMKKPILLKD
jgi:hypothetical protein